MFKKLYNQARIVYQVKPVTPLLIKTGKESFDPTKPDMEFVRTRTPYGEVPYLPGSSLKGVIRSHGERIVRTLNLKCCDLTAKDCGRKINKETPLEDRYGEHCYICKTFGSTSLSSRMRITDANPWSVEAGDEEIASIAASLDSHVPTSRRTNVKIDRQKGASAGTALFDTEVVTGGSFQGEIVLVNYQLWQLALLSLVFRDIDSGFQRVGASKSRGLGRVSFQVRDFQLQQYGALAAEPGELRGIGCLEDKLVQRYKLIGSDCLSSLPSDLMRDEILSTPGFMNCYRPEGEARDTWSELAKTLVQGQSWQSFIEEGEKHESAS